MMKFMQTRHVDGINLLQTKWLNLENKILNKKNNIDYIIYFDKSEKYKQLEDKLFIDAEVIYENEAGGIVKYNK